MSLKLMVRVMEEIDVPRPQQAVLLAMAENADDDGGRCFPSVDLIAWKAGYRARNVTDIIRALGKAGVLEKVAEASGTRPIEYRIHLDEAPQKPTFREWQRVNGRHAKRSAEAARQAARDPVADSHQAHPETRGNAPVRSDEGCSLTSVGVQSHETGVQSHVNETREIAPRTVKDPSGNRQRPPSAAADAAAGAGQDDPETGDSPPDDGAGAGRPPRRNAAAGFEAFWASYPRRVTESGVRTAGSKALALDRWRQLTAAEQAAAAAGVAGYAAERGDRPKDAERYLRQRLWRDYVDDAPGSSSPPAVGPTERIDAEIARIRASQDVEYLGSAGQERRAAEIAALEAERAALGRDGPVRPDAESTEQPDPTSDRPSPGGNPT